MRFFDLASVPEVSESLGTRLGYKKIFLAGKDIEIGEDLAPSKSKKLIRSDNPEIIVKGLRQNDVLGMLPKNISISKKALDAIKDNEKLLVIPLSEATAGGQALVKMRRLIRSVLIAKAPFALVSLAGDKEHLMSSLQMIEVAGFLGVDPARAKEAMGKLGDLL